MKTCECIESLNAKKQPQVRSLENPEMIMRLNSRKYQVKAVEIPEMTVRVNAVLVEDTNLSFHLGNSWMI